MGKDVGWGVRGRLVRIFGGGKRGMVFWVLDDDVLRVHHENCDICTIPLVFCVFVYSWC
jgi:hypothetical protein